MFVGHGEDFEKVGVLGKYTGCGKIARLHGPVIKKCTQTSLCKRKDSASYKLLKDLVRHSEPLETDCTDVISELFCIKMFPNKRHMMHTVYRKVRINKFGKMKRDIYVERGVGIYYIKKDGSLRIMGSLSGGSHNYVVIDNTKLYVHSIMLFVLCPAAFDRYCLNDNLVVNHTRIPEVGETLYETDVRYLELVSSCDNTAHFRFIKRWGLWNVPVSAMAVYDLDKKFEVISQDFGVELKDWYDGPVDYKDTGLKEKFVAMCNELFAEVVNPDYRF